MPAAARACVFSPDGKLMATGGYEQENGVYYARLWEVATGKELRRFAIAHQTNRPIGALAFSHDGTKLAGGAWGDGRLRLFEVATGKELHLFPKIGEDIRSIAFAPDGKTVAAAGDSIHLYDPATGKERLQIDRQARSLGVQPGWLGLDRRRERSNLQVGRGQRAATHPGPGSGQCGRADPGQRRRSEPVYHRPGWRPLSLGQSRQEIPAPYRGGIGRGIVASPDRRLLAWTGPDVHGNSRIRLYDVAAERFLDRFTQSHRGRRDRGGVPAG